MLLGKKSKILSMLLIFLHILIYTFNMIPLQKFSVAILLDLDQFSSVQWLSRVQLFVTPWTAARQASLSITNSQSLLKRVSIESVMPSNHLILLSPSPPTFSLSQHQGLFKWVSSSHQVAKVLEFQLQHQSFWWIFRTGFLQNGLGGSPCSPRDSHTTVQKYQYFSTQISLWSNSHIQTWLLEKP